MYGLENNFGKQNIIFQISRFPFLILFLQDLPRTTPSEVPKENVYKLFLFCLFLMWTSKGAPDNTRRNISQKSTVFGLPVVLIFFHCSYSEIRGFFLECMNKPGVLEKAARTSSKNLAPELGGECSLIILTKRFLDPWKKRFLTSTSNCLCESSI